jgi:hypothetical protein
VFVLALRSADVHRAKEPPASNTDLLLQKVLLSCNKEAGGSAEILELLSKLLSSKEFKVWRGAHVAGCACERLRGRGRLAGHACVHIEGGRGQEMGRGLLGRVKVLSRGDIVESTWFEGD